MSLAADFKYGIVITGVIASGKSTALNILRERGYSVLCADTIAHDMLNANALKVAQVFGSDLLEYNGAKAMINRAKLGKIVFSDANERKKLEEILHPLISEQIFKEIKILERDKKLYFVDIPLFFESGGLDKYRLKCALIYAPKELILKRLMARNDLSKNDALLRISAQMDIEQKRALSDYIIDNSTDLQSLERNIDEFLKQVHKESN